MLNNLRDSLQPHLEKIGKALHQLVFHQTDGHVLAWHLRLHQH